MKNNFTRRLLLVIALSPCLLSCVSNRSHSFSHSKTGHPTVSEGLAVSQHSDFPSPTGQSATHSSSDQWRQAEDLQADANEAFLNNSLPQDLITSSLIEEKTKSFSPQIKASLQNAHSILQTNEANRKAGNQLTKEARKQERKAIRNVLKEAKTTADDQQTLEVILAFLLAPVGVYLHERKANKPFWISLMLWGVGIGLFWTIPFIGLLPAIIFSILVVTDTVNIE